MSIIDDLKEKKERYNPSKREKYWQNFWEKEDIYKFNPNQSGHLYTVDTPPPTISGALHLGHIFSYIQAEVIVRFKRMEGLNIRYPIGIDNNGLPTERLAEKERGIKGQNLKPAKFAKICSDIAEKYKRIYKDLWKSVGLSVDWGLEYSTVSPEVQRLSQSVFKELYERGVIYKKDAPALYCPECQTSFAQAEKENKEKDAIFFDLSFKTEHGQDIIISTTRPELLPACVAVFVNPKDNRYKQFIGKKVKTPMGQKVDVISDSNVDMEKGSGVVMCCTYGDETDIYWAKTYKLKEKIILDKNGKFQNINEFPEINNKSAEEARKIIIEKLKKDGFVMKEQKIKHVIGVHERCGTPVEFLPITQWFVKMLDMKEKLLEAGNKINWHPPYMKKRYEEWVSNLKWDWCISRERFYGIPIPVFNCDNCEKAVIPDKNNFPIDPKTEKIERNCPNCKVGKLVPEKSVLDTWFTSSLTPDINNNHPLNVPRRNKLYPMSMRPQAHDIIRTWAVYSILMGLYRHNEIPPWKNLMVSGHILVKKGEKISKKTGGGRYKPEELIAVQSADAIRYAMCGASIGKDARFDEKEVTKGKRLVTKIYNAGKLVLSSLQNFDPKIKFSKDDLMAFDQWIIQRSLETAQKMSETFSNYEFSQARQIFEDFFWSEFCDNYLEIVKGRTSIAIDNKKKALEKFSAQFSMYQSFLNIIKMASPFVPHITEEMYHAEIVKIEEGKNMNESIKSKDNEGYFYRNEKIKSIHNMEWPSISKEYFDDNTMEGAKLALLLISEIRKVKTANKIRLKEKISLLKIKCSRKKQDILKSFLRDIAYVAGAKKIVVTNSKETGIEIEM